MRKKKRPTRNREGTDSDQDSDANDKATGVNPSGPSVDRRNSADNLADENLRRLEKLADDNLRILSEAAAIHPTAYSQEKSRLIYSRVDQDSSPAQSFKDDSPSTSPEEPDPLKLKRPYTKLIPKLEEDIRKDLKLGVSSDPDIALRWDVRRSTVSNIRRKLKKRPIEEQGDLRKNHAPLTPEDIRLITEDLMSGEFSNLEIAAIHGVSLSTVGNIKRKIKNLSPGERGDLRENYAPLTPKKIELITDDLKTGDFSDPEIAVRQGVSLKTVTNIKSKLMKRPIGERGNLRLRKNNELLTSTLRVNIIKDLMLGTFSDSDIALRWDVRRSTVSGIKRNLNLPLPPVDRRQSPAPSTSQEQPANQQHVAGNEASLLDNSLRH